MLARNSKIYTREIRIKEKRMNTLDIDKLKDVLRAELEVMKRNLEIVTDTPRELLIKWNEGDYKVSVKLKMEIKK